MDATLEAECKDRIARMKSPNAILQLMEEAPLDTLRACYAEMAKHWNEEELLATEANGPFSQDDSVAAHQILFRRLAYLENGVIFSASNSLPHHPV